VDVPWWGWVAFTSGVVTLLLLDLLVLHRKPHKVTFREAGWTSAFWVTLGLLFGGFVFLWAGPQAGGEYLAGFLIEKSLAVDNIFVFALIFTYFAVPAQFQHRVLFWGIVGALMFRAMFIFGGAVMLNRFHWMVYVFGALLVFTGIKMARSKDQEMDPSRNPVLRGFRRLVPMTTSYASQRFFVRRPGTGALMATPLLGVLVVVETSDIFFAIDSIPAIFAVTREPFIVFTSNAFAILGLRAMYFLLAGMMERFVHLKIGLALVLVLVGTKMLVSETVHVPVWATLPVIAMIIAVSIATSLWATRKTEEERATKPAARG
jgi:tellurite resistance protein TerC